MSIILIASAYIGSIYLLFLSYNKNKLFPFIFIFINYYSNIILSLYTADIDGIAFIARIIHLISLIIFIIRSKYSINILVGVIIIYITGYFIASPNIDTLSSITNYASLFLIYIIGINYIWDNEYNVINNIYSTSKIIAIISLVYIAIVMNLGVGKEMYDESYTFGALKDDRINAFVCSLVLMFGILFYSNRLVSKEVIFIILGVSILFIYMKRASIIMLFVSILIMIFQSKMNIKRILYILAALTIIGISSYLFIGNLVQERMETRGEAVAIDYNTLVHHGRYLELIVLPDYIKDSNNKELLFGHGFDKDSSIYRSSYFDDSLRHHTIHSGLVRTIFMNGIVGLILIFYFLIKHLIIFASKINYIKKISNQKITIIIFALPSILILILNYLSDPMFRSFAAFFPLLILGLCYGEYKKLKLYKK